MLNSPRERPIPIPAIVRSNASAANWRARRKRVAPRAPRTATSRRRLSALINIRLETFNSPIIKRRAAPPSRASRTGRTSPRITCESG
jgi:hypothetical protein